MDSADVERILEKLVCVVVDEMRCNKKFELKILGLFNSIPREMEAGDLGAPGRVDFESSGFVKFDLENSSVDVGYGASIEDGGGFAEGSASDFEVRMSGDVPGSTGIDSAVLARGERRGNRRPPAVIDPVDLARKDKDVLLSTLEGLDIEYLKDIVADYGMDPGRKVMRLKKKEKLISLIYEMSLSRANKGSAFME